MNEYHIDSFEKLLNVVNRENVARLGADITLWLIEYVDVVDTIREVFPNETKGKQNYELARASFEWFDDGQVGIIGTEVTFQEPELKTNEDAV